MTKIVITGASGFIGGQTLLAAIDAGYDVLAVDQNPIPAHLLPCQHKFEFMQKDAVDPAVLDYLKLNNPSAVIHCGGTSLVGPSIKDPAVYYHNNTVKTLQLLDTLRDLPGTRLIFSSSAAVYGDPVLTPCYESDPCQPISPYGESKLMTEWMIHAYHRAYGLDFVNFRYFNACGADSQGRHGQAAGATHIIARVLECLLHDQMFNLNGDTYGTADGTCVRDYVHVEDIARAHLIAVNRHIPCNVYNLGSGTAISNRQIIELAEQITGKKLNYVVNPPRPGDPPELTANDQSFSTLADTWRLKKVEDMIRDAWAWYNR